ncbi:MAG: altronate dehydratase [Clostridia bacterium]|nr:altronate dehydratase [Clostridia bacterium]
MLIHKSDNVDINLENGHKYACKRIKKGEAVIKYGMPIGTATEDIPQGAHVHTHNMKTSLSSTLEYEYNPIACEVKKEGKEFFFLGYERENGNVGIRNEVWIIPTVGCVNKVAEKIARETGAKAITHPFGCSQLGGDHRYTQNILRGLVNHPNAAGVLVLGLGCENNNIAEFKKQLGEYDAARVKFLQCQDSNDEIEEGITLVHDLIEYSKHYARRKIPVSKLKIGLKCGGSDGYSGITANPAVGAVSDILISNGGTSIMTEVPEMFGAETLLMERCASREVFDKLVRMVNGFKRYFESYGQPVYENPSPGNKAGGITTLEEKSLGCVQKGGHGPIVDVLFNGDTATKNGLNLLDGPGNDICAITNLTAAGAHMILFTTGRGTPLGAPIPTLKIATNRALAERKSSWIDFDASSALENMADCADALFNLVIEIASGKDTKNEISGYSEIAIFHDGVTL